MAQLIFTQDNLLTLEEFQLLLLEAWLSSNPLDELLELVEQLREYEQRHRVSSSGMRSAKHCSQRTPISISTIFSQLPCLGV